MFDAGAVPGELDLGFAGLGSAPPGTLEVASLSLSVTVNDTDITSLTTLLNAKTTCGWDAAVGEARIELTSKPDGITYGDSVVITGGRKNPPVVRFTGIVRDWDYSNWPKSVTLLARSELTKLEDVIPRDVDVDTDPDEGQPGIDIESLTGSATGSTLRQIVEAVCTYAGLTLPTFTYDPPHIFGDPDIGAPEKFVWRVKETAMAYLHRVFQATAGARIFSSGDGQIYVAQIVGRPRGDVDLALIEGYDIYPGSTGQRSITQTRNAVRVYGFDDGEGTGIPLASIIESNDFQGGANPDYFHEVSSDLIETEEYATEIANFWLQELNREFVHARISTWHDEVQGPAQTHFVVSPRIGINGESLWCISHEIDMAPNSWTVTNSYVGGGQPDSNDPVPI